mgnify:CR=1 FL=1
MTVSTISTTLAHWAHGLALSRVPDETIHAARRALLDTIGVITAGAHHPVTTKTRTAFLGAGGQSSVSGGGSSGASTAALVNGCAAHAYDFDDVSHTGIMHGSAVIAPAVLAVAEQVEATDSDALAAFVAGSEAAYILGDALSHRHFLKGWWTTCTLSGIGAGVAAAKLMGQTPAQIAQVIGLMAANAGCSRSPFGTDGKPFLCGFTAKTAVEMAQAVQATISGPVDAFENESGFLSLLNDGHFDRGVLKSCGEIWRLVDPGLLFKRYPICSSAHAVTEESAVLKQRHGFAVEDVAEVECRVPDVVAQSLVYDDPTTPQECQFSIPFSVACGFHHGEVSLSHIVAGKEVARALRETMAKVRWFKDDQLSTEDMRRDFPECAKVVVRLRQGQSVEGFRRLATGMPAAPLTDDHLADKFRACVEFASGSTETASGSAESILNLAHAGPRRNLSHTVKTLWNSGEGRSH